MGESETVIDWDCDQVSMYVFIMYLIIIIAYSISVQLNKTVVGDIVMSILLVDYSK